MPGYGKHATYGYQWTGFRRDRTLVIDEEAAQIVRRIFEWYDAGVTVIEISDRLTSMRVPRPGAVQGDPRVDDPYRWRPAQLYRILRASIYGGTFYAFTRMDKKTAKKLHATPVPVTVPAIVAPELFQRVQAKLAVGRKYAQRNTKQTYLLRCRVRCGVCDSAMCGTTSGKHRYYRCAAVISRRSTARVCDPRRFIVADVEHTVSQLIETHALHEGNLREGIQRRNATTVGARTKLEQECLHY